jgi:hypothetical protein
MKRKLFIFMILFIFTCQSFVAAVNLRANGTVSLHIEKDEVIIFTVFDKEGNPLQGAIIKNSIQVPPNAPLLGGMITDENGEYKLRLNYDGVYVFVAEYRGQRSNEVDVGVAPGPTDRDAKLFVAIFMMFFFFFTTIVLLYLNRRKI